MGIGNTMFRQFNTLKRTLDKVSPKTRKERLHNMTKNGLPPKQGLYDPQFERDACGIGFVANIKGVKSHEIVKQALRVLCNLDHRGGQGSEQNTGDGAGILMQIPDA